MNKEFTFLIHEIIFFRNDDRFVSLPLIWYVLTYTIGGGALVATDQLPDPVNILIKTFWPAVPREVLRRMTHISSIFSEIKDGQRDLTWIMRIIFYRECENLHFWYDERHRHRRDTPAADHTCGLGWTLKNFLTFLCPEVAIRLGPFVIKSMFFNEYGTCWFHPSHLIIPHQRHCCVLPEPDEPCIKRHWWKKA